MFYWSLECMFHNVPSLRGLFAMNFERCTCPWTQLLFNMGEMCLSIVLKPWSSYKLFFRFYLAWFSVSYTNSWLAGGLPAECVLPSSSHCWAGIPVNKNCPVHAAWHSHSASSGRELRLAADEPFVVWNCSTPPQASPRGDISTTWKKRCPYLFKNNLSMGVFGAIRAIHFQAYLKLDIRTSVCRGKRDPKLIWNTLISQYRSASLFPLSTHISTEISLGFEIPVQFSWTHLKLLNRARYNILPF